MWVELGIERPGQQVTPRVWVNTDHIVRVEFEAYGKKATVITSKPGGSDRTFFVGDDAERLKLSLDSERRLSGAEYPSLAHEIAEIESKNKKKKVCLAKNP